VTQARLAPIYEKKQFFPAAKTRAVPQGYMPKGNLAQPRINPQTAWKKAERNGALFELLFSSADFCRRGMYLRGKRLCMLSFAFVVTFDGIDLTLPLFLILAKIGKFFYGYIIWRALREKGRKQ
jgi:hypothetical protein